MSNKRNWVAQKDCPYAAGSVDVTTGATPESPGDATFAQAFGAGPIDVYWSLEDASDPPRSMAGIGSLSGGSIDVSSPSSTFDGTTYDDSPSGVITLVSPVTIRCTLLAEYATSVSETHIPAVGGQGTYSFAHDSSDVLQIAYNGQLLRSGTDYTNSSAADTITLLFTEVTGDDILVTRYSGTIGSGDTNLSNAEFPDYAVFDEEFTEAPSGGTTAVDFTKGNNQDADCGAGAENPNITVASPLNKPGHFTLKIDNSSNLGSLAPAAGGLINWAGSTAPSWAGTTIVSFYYNGAAWYGSALVDVGTV